MHEAKTHLSRLIASIKAGTEEEIVIAQNGVPAARLVPVAKRQELRWGLAKGLFSVPDDIDRDNALIEALFYGEAD